MDIATAKAKATTRPGLSHTHNYTHPSTLLLPEVTIMYAVSNLTDAAGILTPITAMKNRHSNHYAIGPSNHYAIGPSNHYAIGPSNHYAIGPSNHYAIGPSNHYAIGPSNHYAIGPSNHYAIGPLCHRPI